jgi:hypothetical protein
MYFPNLTKGLNVLVSLYEETQVIGLFRML